MNIKEISNNHLLGIRCLCIIGIIFGHSYVPAVYETGHLWRVPILFLLGGASLIKSRPVSSTVKYVLKDFYIYTVIWSLIYLAAIYVFFLGEDPGKFVRSFDLTSIFISDIFVHNNHKNLIILGSWFLIPYALSLLLLSVAANFIPRPAYAQFATALILLLISFYFILPSYSWPHRLVAQVFFAAGLMLLGRAIFLTSILARNIQKGWVILITFGLALWLSKGFGRLEITWSWMTSQGNYWLLLPTTILFIPVVFWLGKQISIFPIARYVGSQSKHIMMHHLFGFLLVNLILVKMGYTTKGELSPFFTFKGPLLWPVYLVSALAWSLFASQLSKNAEGVLRRITSIAIARARPTP